MNSKNQEAFELHRQERLRFLNKPIEEKVDQIINSQAILFYRCHNQRVFKTQGRYMIDAEIREVLRGELSIFFSKPENKGRCFADREIFEEYLEQPLRKMNPVELGAYKSLMKTIFMDIEIANKAKESTNTFDL